MASIDEMTLHEDRRDPTTFLYATERRFLSSLVNSEWSFYNFIFYRDPFYFSRASFEKIIDKKDKKYAKVLFFLSKYTYQCHFRWPISWTRPYHRTVRPVRTIWHVIRIQPFGLRSSFFSSFLFLDFCAFWICFFRFWNWKREKRRITSHHSHPRKNAINLLMLIAPKPEHFGFYFYLWHFFHVMKIILICNNIKYYVDKVGYFEDISFWIGQWVFLNGTAWMEIPQKSFLRIVTSQSAIFTIQ